MDASLTELRVLQQVAECGTFTAAAERLGYTQSAVSRQIANLERSTGHALFERRRSGVRLTPAGRTLLRHARAALAEMAAARRELDGTGRAEVRLGVFPSAGATLLPAVLTTLARTEPDLVVTTREGTTPALVRALRAGSLQVAVISRRAPFGPPDQESPALVLDTLATVELVVAVARTGRFGGVDSVHVDELVDADWIASPGSGAEPLLGVWPGLTGRPRITHRAHDWLTKLELVRADCGITTVTTAHTGVLPEDVRTVRVEGGPAQRRRISAARLPGPAAPGIVAVLDALRTG